MHKKLIVTIETYIENDGWENFQSSKPQKYFETRKEAETEYGRFFNRLPKGKPNQILNVYALWRLEKDNDTIDEVVGYIIIH